MAIITMGLGPIRIPGVATSRVTHSISRAWRLHPHSWVNVCNVQAAGSYYPMIRFASRSDYNNWAVCFLRGRPGWGYIYYSHHPRIAPHWTDDILALVSYHELWHALANSTYEGAGYPPNDYVRQTLVRLYGPPRPRAAPEEPLPKARRPWALNPWRKIVLPFEGGRPADTLRSRLSAPGGLEG